MKNIVAGYMKKTASLEEDVRKYLDGISDEALFDIAMTIDHYTDDLGAIGIMDMDDLESSVGDMSPVELIQMGANGFDTTKRWYRYVSMENGYESFNADEFGRELREDYMDDIVNSLSHNVSSYVYRDLPQELRDIIYEGENEE